MSGAAPASLDGLMQRAHDRADNRALIVHYTAAADLAEGRGDIDAACFFLTHAYVFALESGARERDALNLRLWCHGREVRYAFPEV